jgi:hypothetical protein
MKFDVYGIYTASKYLGEVEAESKEKAEDKVWNDEGYDTLISLCHQCTNELEVGDVYKLDIEEKT